MFKLTKKGHACEYCSAIKLVDNFGTPNEYEKTIDYIKELINSRHFVLMEGNCELGCHKDSDGHWIGDVIYHTIKCPKCGQTYSCIVNTYRGGGSFRRG